MRAPAPPPVALTGYLENDLGEPLTGEVVLSPQIPAIELRGTLWGCQEHHRTLVNGAFLIEDAMPTNIGTPTGWTYRLITPVGSWLLTLPYNTRGWVLNEFIDDLEAD